MWLLKSGEPTKLLMSKAVDKNKKDGKMILVRDGI